MVAIRRITTTKGVMSYFLDSTGRMCTSLSGDEVCNYKKKILIPTTYKFDIYLYMYMVYMIYLLNILYTLFFLLTLISIYYLLTVTIDGCRLHFLLFPIHERKVTNLLLADAILCC